MIDGDYSAQGSMRRVTAALIFWVLTCWPAVLWGGPYPIPKHAIVGRQYSFPLETTPPHARVSWQLAGKSRLPDGLKLTRAGELRGVPTQAGIITFTVVLKPGGGSPQDLVLTIDPAPGVMVAKPDEPAAAKVEIRGLLRPGQTQFFVNTADRDRSNVSVRVNGAPADLRAPDGSIAGSVPSDTAKLQASITLKTPLAAGDWVQAAEQTAAGSAWSPEVAVEDPLDLGRVGYYFTAGIVFSNDQGFQTQSSGSRAATFLGLDVDRSWLVTDRPRWRRLGVNTYLDARLTSVPTQMLEWTGSSSLSSYLRSQKAASFETGAYVPVTTAEWTTANIPYSFFLAPLATAGFVTVTDDAAAIAVTSTGRFFTFYSYGARLGVFRNYRKAAPRTVSYVDLTVGRFGNFEAYRAAGPENPGAPAGSFLTQRPWRYSFEGLLKIPGSPLAVGFDANIGQGAPSAAKVSGMVYPYTPPGDDLRFLVAARFDFRKILAEIPRLP